LCEDSLRAKGIGGYVRPKPFSTADTDYDVVVPRGRQQAHFRLKEVHDNACLVPSHVEPSDPIWHVRCWFEDLLLGEKSKSADCTSFYMDSENIIDLLKRDFKNLRLL